MSSCSTNVQKREYPARDITEWWVTCSQGYAAGPFGTESRAQEDARRHSFWASGGDGESTEDLHSEGANPSQTAQGLDLDGRETTRGGSDG